MIKNYTKTLLALAMILNFATACSTIYFHNGTASGPIQNGEWHHDGIIRLVEFSDPVDMSSRCRASSWTSIRTERTFLNGLAGAVSFGLYDPWDVSFGCTKVATTTNQKAPSVKSTTKAKKKKK